MFLYLIDLLGTLVFAISGCIVAYEKKFDLFGGFVLATVTAIGGGTLRDLLIGNTPVSWTLDLNYLWFIILGVIISFFFRRHVLALRKTMFLFDTIGIALFTILGIQKTLALGLSPVIALLMGTISAVFGGILRDVLSNEAPLIFRKELYATVCIFGGVIYLLMEKIVSFQWISICLAIGAIAILRVLSVTKHWSLPTMK
jgi:uncharacterized membrane protein YeiH